MHHTKSPEGKSVIDILGTFISTHRDEIIARAEAHARARSTVPATRWATDAESSHGNPAFLDQLADALRRGETGDGIDREPLTTTAARHGQQLLRMGMPLAQVVHDYGDVCQAITDLAVEQEAWIPAASFRALNLCLDDAIAEAVTEYSRHREHAIEAQGIEKLGILVHEMRNLLGLATLSFESIRTSGPAAQEGRSGIVCARSLMDLSSLIDRSLADVRLDAGVEHIEKISISEFMGLLLIMSVPAIAIDMAGAIMTTSYLNFGEEQDHVLCVNTGMIIGDERIRGHFLLIPDATSLQIMLREMKLG